MVATLVPKPPTQDGRLWLLARNIDSENIASWLAVDSNGTEQVQGREVLRVRRSITGNLLIPRLTTGVAGIGQGGLGWVQADWPAWVRISDGENFSVGDFASFETTAARGHAQRASNFHAGLIVLAVVESTPPRVLLGRNPHSFCKARFARIRFPTGGSTKAFRISDGQVESGWSGHVGSGNHFVDNLPISSDYMFSADNNQIGVGIFDSGARLYFLIQMEP